MRPVALSTNPYTESAVVSNLDISIANIVIARKALSQPWTSPTAASWLPCFQTRPKFAVAATKLQVLQVKRTPEGTRTPPTGHTSKLLALRQRQPVESSRRVVDQVPSVLGV